MATFIDSTGGKAIVTGIANKVKSGFVPLNSDKKIDSSYLPSGYHIVYFGAYYKNIDATSYVKADVVNNVSLMSIPSGTPDQPGTAADRVYGVVWDSGRQQFLLYVNLILSDGSEDGYITFEQASAITMPLPDDDFATTASPGVDVVYIGTVFGTVLVSQSDGASGTIVSTPHTHSVKINGNTKTIAASGGTAVDLGTYVTASDVVPTTDINSWITSAFA